jgi:hypothetical protein
MNTLFAPMLINVVLMFMGDVIVYNSTLKQHIKLLDQVFTIL